MKIALVLPPILPEERYDKSLVEVVGSLPPLGLLSIGTVLKNAGHDVVVLDGSIRGHDVVMSAISDFAPELIGITALTVMWPKARAFCREIREAWPHVLLIAGGVHASLIRERALEEIPELDAVCWGEGEYAMQEFASACRSLSSSPPIPGIAFRIGGEVISGPDREPISDLDTLPIPDRGFVPVTDYVPAIEQYKTLPVTNMVTARGCPFRCLFCLPDLLGKGLRQRSAAAVMAEIELLTERFGIREIAFWDDTFTVDRERVLSLCRHLGGLKKKVIWSAQARADCVTPEMLRLMAQAGCWKVFYGVESLVQKNLDVVRKGETVEQLFQAVSWTKEAGIEVEASFMFGIPGESFADGLETIRLAKKLAPDYAKFFFFTPYGSLVEEIKQYGTVLTEDEGRFMGNMITFVPFSMTAEELQRLHYIAYREFYFRPGYIYGRLKKLRDPLELRKSIKGFFALKGLLANLRNK